MSKSNKIKRVFAVFFVVAVLSAGIGLFANRAHAEITGSTSLSTSKSSVDMGEQFTVSFTISSSEAALLGGSFSVTGGIRIIGASINNGASISYNATSVTLYCDNANASYSGSITCQADTPGNANINASPQLAKMGEKIERAYPNKSTSVYVRTAVETQQIKDNEEAARKAEEARQASIAESKRAEQASIAAKMAEEASRKASEEAIKNSAVAESASVAESIRESEEESRSLEESVAESIKASESEEAKTRATEIEDVGYALITWGKNLGTENEPAYEHQFFAAVQDNEMKIPAGYKKANLIVNKNKVLALKKDGMDENTYLVYGMFKENEEPLWYYYNSMENSFFPYEYLNSDTVFEDNPVEKDDATSLSAEMKRDTLIDLGFTGLVGALAGVFVTLLCKPGSYNKKSNNHRDDAPDDREDEE